MAVNTIFLAQHAIAIDKTVDSERPISAEGIKQTQLVARQLLTSSMAISAVFHSGKLRAQQTAEIFADTLQINNLIEIGFLSPNESIALFIQNLTTDKALYIGHLPHLEKLTSKLVCGDENAGIVNFQNSSVLCLQNNNEHHWQIQWYATPALVAE